MRSASEGYNPRYAGDLPPRHGGSGGAPQQIRPLPTPRPSPAPSYYPESISRDAYPDYATSSYYAAGYQSPHRSQQLPPDEQYRGGASGVRQDSRRGLPSDSYRPNDGPSHLPAARGNLSPRPSPRFDDSPHGDLYQSYGSPPARSHPSLAPLPPRSPLPPSAIVTATADLESLIVVPLNNLSTIEAIKEVIMTRLHIADDDQPRHAFYLTRIGAGEGRPVSDEELWTAVKSSTRGDGPQITVYVKEMGSPRAGQWEGRSAAEFASAAGGYHDRARNMHARDRESSRSSGSGGGGRPPSPISAASFHRQKSPSVSSSRNSDPAALMAQEMSRNRTFDETEAARRAQGGSGASLSGRHAPSASYVNQRMTTSPQSASTILSPLYDSRFILSGSAPRTSSNTTPKTSPEEYFHYTSAQHQTVTSPAGSSSLSPPPSASQSHAQSPQTFGGPSTRRLPSAPAATMPEPRTQTVPLLSVTCGDWSRPVQAAMPQHSPSLPTSHTFAPHPPRALPPTDPRSTMRQYASDPYRNLPLPSNQSPYHNLSLQGRSNVVHLPQPPRNGFSQNTLPPRAATLAAPSQAGLAMSRSADNLRSTYDQSAIEPVGLSRSPASRVTPQPTGRSSNEAPSSSSGLNLASAFYSAPVQAQQQSSNYAPRGGPSPFSPPAAATSRSDWSAEIDRPNTATGLMRDHDRSRAREGNPSSLLGIRRQSAGTVEDLSGHLTAQLSLRNDSQRSARIEPAAPQFAEDDGAYDGISERSRAPSHPSIETLAQTAASPPSSTRSSLTGPITPASDISHNRFSITPATVEKPRLVDEFGDPLDEETGTWFPVNQPAATPASTPSSDRKPAETASSSSPQATTAVPAAKAYGVTSPTRTQVKSPQQSLKQAERRTSVPDAQDWTQTILSRFGASSATDSGTLLPAGASGTLRPASSVPSAPSSAVHTPTLVDEFGDDLEDSSTFFPGHGPASKDASVSQDDAGKERSLSNRPSLKLNIGANATPPPTSAPPTSQSGRDSDRSAGRGSSSSDFESSRPDRRIDGPPSSRTRRYFPSRQDRPGAETPFARRNSLAARASDDNDWAFRPPVETVLEHLDVFFPQHDLDKPVFDLAASPATGATSSNASPAKDHPSTTPNRRLGYHKSIRVVAQDRKRMLQKAGRNVATAASGLASNLLRRRSTKLFGAKIEEVTSAQMNDISALHEVDNDDPENFSYKWIKGDLIGRGTYGHVYIALSVTTGETIAVKQVEMPRSFSDKEDQRIKGMISSLKAEIELLKDLDHPNIVLYLGMEQTPEFLSIFLEYVPGGSIGRIIRTHGKFEEDVIRFFTLQILDGLEYLHSLGILHRDMKADNILIDQDGMCKISDFGTSKKSGDIYQNNENMSMQGSIFWMAPEVIHNNKQGYSAKADIWSLGCICIEMLAGSRPWEGEGFMGAMFKLGAERMRPPLPPDVTLSQNADRFVGDCLQIEPELRPKASEAKLHPFLTSLDPNWTFDQTALYRIMTDEEQRRRLPVQSNSSATHS